MRVSLLALMKIVVCMGVGVNFVFLLALLVQRRGKKATLIGRIPQEELSEIKEEVFRALVQERKDVSKKFTVSEEGAVRAYIPPESKGLLRKTYGNLKKTVNNLSEMIRRRSNVVV